MIEALADAGVKVGLPPLICAAASRCPRPSTALPSCSSNPVNIPGRLKDQVASPRGHDNFRPAHTGGRRASHDADQRPSIARPNVVENSAPNCCRSWKRSTRPDVGRSSSHRTPSLRTGTFKPIAAQPRWRSLAGVIRCRIASLPQRIAPSARRGLTCGVGSRTHRPMLLLQGGVVVDPAKDFEGPADLLITRRPRAAVRCVHRRARRSGGHRCERVLGLSRVHRPSNSSERTRRRIQRGTFARASPPPPPADSAPCAQCPEPNRSTTNVR